jgi:hypothetical protein
MKPGGNRSMRRVFAIVTMFLADNYTKADEAGRSWMRRWELDGLIDRTPVAPIGRGPNNSSDLPGIVKLAGWLNQIGLLPN